MAGDEHLAITKKYVDDKLKTSELFFGRLTSDQNMPVADTIYKVLIDTADIDTLGGFDTYHNRYIIQNSGYFKLLGQGWILGGVLSAGYYSYIRINEASPESTEYWIAGCDFWGEGEIPDGALSPKAIWPVRHLNLGDRVELMASSKENNQVIHGTEEDCGHKTCLSVIEWMRD